MIGILNQKQKVLVGHHLRGVSLLYLALVFTVFVAYAAWSHAIEIAILAIIPFVLIVGLASTKSPSGNTTKK
jgi:hypothetical protein